MFVLVAGSLKDAQDAGKLKRFKDVCRTIGRLLAERGASIILGSEDIRCADLFVADGANSANVSVNTAVVLVQPAEADPNDTDEYARFDRLDISRRICSGTWQDAALRSLQLECADVVVLIGGGYGTSVLAGLACSNATPTIPLAAFGGAAAKFLEHCTATLGDFGVTSGECQQLGTEVDEALVGSILDRIAASPLSGFDGRNTDQVKQGSPKGSDESWRKPEFSPDVSIPPWEWKILSTGYHQLAEPRNGLGGFYNGLHHNTAGTPYDPQPGIVWTVEEYAAKQRVYRELGRDFLPGLIQGSPACESYIISVTTQASLGDAQTFVEMLAGRSVKTTAAPELRRAYNSLILSCDEIGGDRREALLKLRVQVCRAHDLDVSYVADLPLTEFMELLADATLVRDIRKLDEASHEKTKETAVNCDIFLSHSSKDKPDVKRVGEALKKRGISVWLDEWNLRPGHSWQDELEEIITKCKSAAVFVGENGIGPWEDPEMKALLRRFVQEKKSGNIIPVIPVLLPNAPATVRLPLFLEEFTWVDLRDGVKKEGIERLVWGITGTKPNGA